MLIIHTTRPHSTYRTSCMDVAKRAALKPVPWGPSRASPVASQPPPTDRTRAEGARTPPPPPTRCHPTDATDSACTRLPRDFFARWLPTDPASVSIGVAWRSHAARGRLPIFFCPLLPGSNENAAAYSFAAYYSAELFSLFNQRESDRERHRSSERTGGGVARGRGSEGTEFAPCARAQALRPSSPHS